MDDRGKYDPAHPGPLRRRDETDAHLGLVLLEYRRNIEHPFHALQRVLKARLIPQVADDNVPRTVATRLLRLLHRADEAQRMHASLDQRRHHQAREAAGRTNDKSVSHFSHVDLLLAGTN